MPATCRHRQELLQQHVDTVSNISSNMSTPSVTSPATCRHHQQHVQQHVDTLRNLSSNMSTPLQHLQQHVDTVRNISSNTLLLLTLLITASCASISRILNQIPMFSARSATARLRSVRMSLWSLKMTTWSRGQTSGRPV